MKAKKIVGIVIILLVVIAISYISFVGIYKDVEENKVNIIPSYKLGMEFNETYDLVAKVKKDSSYNVEEYENMKTILKKRLKQLGVNQYTMFSNKDTGEIKIQLKQNDEMKYVLTELMQKGELKIVDSEDETVLLDNNDLKLAQTTYAQSETGTIDVYLQMKFNKDGTKKLEEISKKYIETEIEQTNEAGEIESVKDIKKVSVKIDEATYSTTYFGETITNGILFVSLFSLQDSSEIQLITESLNDISAILNNAILMDIYEFSTETSEPMISIQELKIYSISIGIVFALAIIYLIVRFNKYGKLVSLLQIGYVALLLLIVRFTNVVIAISGIMGLVLSVVFNYLLLYMILENVEKKKNTKEAFAQFFKLMVPVLIVAVIFTFVSYDSVNSVGMVLFWGTITTYIFNSIFTNTILKLQRKK